VPYPSAEQQYAQPYYEQPPAFEQPRGGQPLTGYSGSEFGQSPPLYQEPDPPVDPRSQQIQHAYQQAANYEQSSAGTQPQMSYESEPRLPDYSGQQPQHRAAPYDDPFGHPQNQQPSAYQPQQQGTWDQPHPESTVRLDPAMYQGDALNGPRREGDDPIDPTAIYTPNDPRR
jgi:hypothetical protein